jgi:hypothetical protein
MHANFSRTCSVTTPLPRPQHRGSRWRLRRPWRAWRCRRTGRRSAQPGQRADAAGAREIPRRVRDFNCSSQGPSHRVRRRCSLMVERPSTPWQMWGSIPSAGPKSVRLEVEAALDDRPHPGDDHDRRHGRVDVAGVQEGEGSGVSARILDEAASGPPRS